MLVHFSLYVNKCGGDFFSGNKSKTLNVKCFLFFKLDTLLTDYLKFLISSLSLCAVLTC